VQGNRSGACNMPATTSQPSTAQPRRIDRVTGTCPVRRSDRNRKGAQWLRFTLRARVARVHGEGARLSDGHLLVR